MAIKAARYTYQIIKAQQRKAAGITKKLLGLQAGKTLMLRRVCYGGRARRASPKVITACVALSESDVCRQVDLLVDEREKTGHRAGWWDITILIARHPQRGREEQRK